MAKDKKVNTTVEQDLSRPMTAEEAKEHVFFGDRCDPKKEIRFYSFLIEQNQDEALFIDMETATITKISGPVADYYCSRANEKRDLGMFDEALLDCNQAILLWPDCSDAYATRGTVYEEIGAESQAVTDYEKAIAIDNNPYAASYCGSYYDKNGMFEKAMNYYNMAVLEFLKDKFLYYDNLSEEYFRRGRLHEKMGCTAEAYEDYTSAIERETIDYRVYWYRGDISVEQNEYAKALADYNQAIILQPDEGFLYWRKGNLYEKMDCADKALEEYTKAIHLDPSDHYTYWARGNLHMRRGEYKDALNDFNQAILLQPETDYIYRYRDRGSLYEKMGCADSAIKDYEQAIKLEPDEWLAYILLAELYEKQGNLEQAVAIYSSAIERGFPDAAIYYYCRGYAYSLMGVEYEVAAEMDYDKAVNLFKENAMRHNDAQQYEKAISEITCAIEIKPEEDLMLYRHRGNMYFNCGDYDRAIADFDHAISMVSGDCYILASLYHDRGRAFSQKELYHEAIDSYTIAIDMVERIKNEVFVERYYRKLYGDRAAAYEQIGLNAAAACDRAVIEALL